MPREPHLRQMIDRSAGTPRAREHAATPLTEKVSVRKVNFSGRMAPNQGAHKRGRDEEAPRNHRLVPPHLLVVQRRQQELEKMLDKQQQQQLLQQQQQQLLQQQLQPSRTLVMRAVVIHFR